MPSLCRSGKDALITVSLPVYLSIEKIAVGEVLQSEELQPVPEVTASVLRLSTP